MLYCRYLDIILAVLYHRRQTNPDAPWLDFAQLTGLIEYPHRASETHSLASLMQSRNHVLLDPYLGGIKVMISPAGKIYIETKPEALGSARIYMDRLLACSETESIMGVQTGREKVLRERKNIFIQLNKINDIFEKNSGPVIHDLLKDVLILKLELEKLDPNQWIIERKLSILSGVDSIHNEYFELKALLKR